MLTYAVYTYAFYTYAASPQSSKRCGKRWGCPCLFNHGMRGREREGGREADIETETDAATKRERESARARERASERETNSKTDKQKKREERERAVCGTHPKKKGKKRNVPPHFITVSEEVMFANYVGVVGLPA